MFPGSGRSPGERNGYLLWYSGLENSMDRGAWWTTVHKVAESGTAEPVTPSPPISSQDLASLSTVHPAQPAWTWPHPPAHPP